MKVFLIGDAGYDEFVHDANTRHVPSGSFFMQAVMPQLLEEPVECLNVEAKGDSVGRKVATLKLYGNSLRIASYAHAGSPDRSRTLTATPKLAPLPGKPGRAGSQDAFLVAHHAGEAWGPDCKATLSSFFKDWFPLEAEGRQTSAVQQVASRLPRILVNLSSGLPQLNTDPMTAKEEPFKSPFWNVLYERRPDVGIVVSVSSLRSESGAISRRLSWEQGVEDIASEIHVFPRLNMLSRFRHLFIRVGMVGFVHIERSVNPDKGSTLSGNVYFSPYASGGIYRDQELEGTTVGKNTICIAALLRGQAALLREKRSESTDPTVKSEWFRDIFWRAMRGMRAADDKGYEPKDFRGPEPSGVRGRREAGSAVIRNSLQHAFDSLTESQTYLEWSRSTFSKPFEDSKKFDQAQQAVLARRPIPEHLLVPLPGSALRSPSRWHILDDVLLEAPVHRINVAMAIVKVGQDKVLNRQWNPSESQDADDDVFKLLTRVERWNPRDHAPDIVTLKDDDMPATPQWPMDKHSATHPIIVDLRQPFELSVPLMRFDALTVIEREELESLRGISNLLRSYATQARSQKDKVPFSIAVFGYPGTGKSFAIKQIASGLGKDLIAPILEFNVAQFRDVKDLRESFERVKKGRESAEKPTIPLVFFDEFDCVWEGTELGWLKYFLAPMQDGEFNDIRKLGPAIFVFAGGLYPTFERFDPQTDAVYENRRDSEDYRRRLAQFVSQKGPDFSSRLRGHVNVLSINDVPGRLKHFVRRAIQLRGILKKVDRIGQGSGLAMVDDAVIYALLTVDQYRHGVRSMQAILEMCSPIHGRIEVASLPSRAQLDMHVDAEEFFLRVHRGRMRAQPEWEPNAWAQFDRAIETVTETLDRLGRELDAEPRERLKANLREGLEAIEVALKRRRD